MNNSRILIALFCMTDCVVCGAEESPQPAMSVKQSNVVAHTAITLTEKQYSGTNESVTSAAEVGFDPRQDIRDQNESVESLLGRAEALINAGTTRNQESSGPLYGDEDGVEALNVVGDNIPAKELMARQQQAGRLGGHEGDPEGTMAISASEDPIDSFIESVDKAGAAARSINEAAEEIDELGEEDSSIE